MRLNLASFIGGLLMAVGMSHMPAHADAALYGFDRPHDVAPRLFTVVFKSEGLGWAIDLTRSPPKLMAMEKVRSALRQDKALSTRLALEIAGSFNGRVLAVYHAALKGFAVDMDESDARYMATDPRIESISVSVPTTTATTQTSAPWALARISQRNLPLGTTYTYFDDGSNTSVFVVDAGVRGVTAGIDVIAAINDSCVTAGLGNFSCTPTPSGVDCYGHGSAMGSIISGATYGVAKNTTLISVLTQDCEGHGFTTYWTTGLDWILDTYFGSNTGVINFSSSDDVAGAADPALISAVTSALRAGFIVVAAASPNVANDSCQYEPGNINGVISVAATDDTDAVWANSATGGCISLYAPGVAVDATDQNGNHVEVTGQSPSAALVSGVAALWFGHYGPASSALGTLVASATSNVVHPSGGAPYTFAYLLSACFPGNNSTFNQALPGFCGAGGGGTPSNPGSNATLTVALLMLGL